MKNKNIVSIILICCAFNLNAQSNKALKARIDSLEKRITLLLSAISELKKRPAFDTLDTDGDGVIDAIDQERDTPSGAKVDTRGVTLDSDGDGVPDYNDKEPCSPIGHRVDKNGIAQISKSVYTTEADVDRIAERKLADLKETIGKQAQEAKVIYISDFSEIITYDKNKTEIEPDDYEILAKTASLLKSQPIASILIICIVTYCLTKSLVLLRIRLV
jgi:OmpA-OmpF porin, OOP family